MDLFDMIEEIDTTLYRWEQSLPKDVGVPMHLREALEIAQIKGSFDTLTVLPEHQQDAQTARLWRRFTTLKSRLDGSDAVAELVDTSQMLFDTVKDGFAALTQIPKGDPK